MALNPAQRGSRLTGAPETELFEHHLYFSRYTATPTTSNIQHRKREVGHAWGDGRRNERPCHVVHLLSHNDVASTVTPSPAAWTRNHLGWQAVQNPSPLDDMTGECATSFGHSRILPADLSELGSGLRVDRRRALLCGPCACDGRSERRRSLVRVARPSGWDLANPYIRERMSARTLGIWVVPSGTGCCVPRAE